MTGKRVSIVERPYLFVYGGPHSAQLVTSEEAQRVIDQCDLVSASPSKVVLRGFGGDEPWTFAVQPATYGGGPAFVVEKIR